jgi:AcrR family transcriptional regulator
VTKAPNLGPRYSHWPLLIRQSKRPKVQYYFGTKEQLLLAAMQQLAAQFSDRVLARIQRMKETGSPASPCDVIAAILTEALPGPDG